MPEDEPFQHASLEWLHRVREEHYKEEAGKPLRSLEPAMTAEALALVRRLGLVVRKTSRRDRGE